MLAAVHPGAAAGTFVRALHPTQELAEKVRSAMHRCCLFQCRGYWKGQLEALPPAELRQVIEWIGEREESLEPLAPFLSVEQLQGLTQLRSAQSMLKEAETYLNGHSHITPTLKTRLLNLLEIVITFIESIVASFGIGDFFKPSENSLHAEFKAQKIMMLLSWFTMLTGLLAPLIGAEMVAWIVGGTLLIIAGLSLLLPYIRVAPTQLPEGENWSKLLREGKLHAVQGRRECLDQIARALAAGTRVKTHPMLIGKSGVGKTETIKALVQAIERGDYPALKGKQVIYFNTATLVQHQEMFGGGNKILSRISEEMGRHREKYILVFDEIHYALKEKEGSAIGEQLKTMLDPGNENFPYVIGVTTEQEYDRDIYGNHAAFARRFKLIPISNPQPHETLEILSNTLLQYAKETLVDPGALSHLLEKTTQLYPEAPQPYTAQKILMKCIQATSEGQRSPLERRVAALRSQLESLYAQAAVAPTDPHSAATLEAQLHLLETQLSQEKGALSRLFQLKQQLADTKRKTMQKVIQAAHSSNLTPLYLLNNFQLPLLETRLRREATRLGVHAAITAPLIDQMIAEETANDIRLRGQEEFVARIGPHA